MRNSGYGASPRGRLGGLRAPAAVVATMTLLLSGCTPGDSDHTDGASSRNGATPAAASSSPTESSDATTGAGTGTRRKGTSGKDSQRDLYRVTDVVDGDTALIDIHGGDRVRIIGIDAPDDETECGSIASGHARRLLEGKRVALDFDATQPNRDRDSQLLAYVEIPGKGDFGEFMLTQGHAREATVATAPYDRQAEYRVAEQTASSAKRGLWGECA